MKTLSAGLADHLAGEVTTLCRCWKIIRADASVLGFTDHDRDLSFDTVTFAAASGFDAGDMEQNLGLNPDSQEVIGALNSPAISADDIHADRYDGARVELWLVNWLLPDERVLDRVFTIGEIREEGGAFRAELRSLSAEFDQTSGRRFSRQCDADLGDARCGVDLESTLLSATLTVTGIRGELSFEADGLSDFPSNWFRGGHLRFVTGANAGVGIEVAEHIAGETGASLHLWKPMAFGVAIGDVATLTAGCDKSFGTCIAKFANGVNFRGCPHIPGNDFALGYASTFRLMDGEPLFK